MRGGDVLGHEFMGTVAEIGRGVTKHQVGDRVVVVSFTSCGQCWYCRQGLWSLCDNGNPNPGITEVLWGQSIGGCYDSSNAMGGWAGSHAQYIRMPYADQGAFAIPGNVSDERALFASDAAPTGWTGALVASGKVAADHHRSRVGHQVVGPPRLRPGAVQLAQRDLRQVLGGIPLTREQVRHPNNCVPRYATNST